MTRAIQNITAWWSSLDHEVRIAWVVIPIISICIAVVAWIESVPGELEDIPMSGERHYRGYA